MTDTIDPSYAGDGVYREHILDHYRNPRNAGALVSPTFVHREVNPLCGDDITFSVALEREAITDLRFAGKGCAISQAAASMLSEEVKGKAVAAVRDISREQVIALLGIPIGPVRVKCAMLGLVTLKNGLARHQKDRPASASQRRC